MDPDKISEEAKQERERQTRLNNKKKSEIVSGKSFQEKSPESFYVFHRIYPYYYNFFLWFFMVFTLGIVALFLYFFETSDERVLYAGIFFCSAFALRLLVFWTVKLFRFRYYKNWRKDLPFELTGWENLGSSKNLPASRVWDRYTEVKVILKSNAIAMEKQLVKDAVYLFCTRSNEWFYTANQVQAGYAGDIRVKWEMTDEHTAKGSANGPVLGCCYLLVDQYLRAIQNKYDCIARVEVNFSKNFITIEPPDSD